MSAPRTPAVADPVVVAAGTTAADAVAAAGLPANGPKAIVVVRDPQGQLRDLDWSPAEETVVEPVSLDSPDGLNVLRHSTAHVLAQAVQDVFPEAKLGIGPPIENGFYYDFDVDKPFQPDDLSKLEKRMQEIIKSGQRFRRRRFGSLDEARSELADEPFKLELIEVKGEGLDTDEVMEVGGGELTIYDNLDAKEDKVCWSDLCRGPHLPTTRLIGAFKLMRSAAAYWRGSEKNPQLQRVYGTAWPTRDELKAYLKLLEEAARRDHRKLGADLDLFSFPDEIGSGLAVFHPKGGIIRREMEHYSRQRHEAAGYEFVNTPHITKAQLFQTSGHLPYYADTMFPPMQLEGADYYLKAMNCPMHNLIFRSRGRSYRELPLRMFEFGTVYRYEKSGVVHGLTRVRGLTQDDSHIYCTREQMAGELSTLLSFVLDLLRDYGLDDFYLELSTRDDSPKFIGADEDWAEATEALRTAAETSGLDLVPDPGGAAFYGPKISVQARDAIGRTWQMSTIQVDFNQPERFALEYQAADGSRQRPVMIHRALFGSIERFFGVLTEHYAGAFPAWLAPVQVVGIPIREDHTDYLHGFVAALRAEGIRAQVDAGDDRMQKKIRTAQQQKIPFMVIAGDDDVAAGTVSFRYRDGSQRNGVPVAEAVTHVLDVVSSRTNIGPSAAAE
ncbi:threonine--tRNA ligase [Micromonospora saelicesensis]|uniref:Threonine--tRNA ligase n=1 Tax=Micromonospora saelicesensis TaxID=285676 RepID=A0A1C4XXN4_9ACTN|nr:threonine--tRNA ligase [Micromonospora saelicesensis]RAN95372.1 Threonine--tRNA ligase [Micromonospora saelicesensis]RAO28769.1 Threonine--tRNA ligase [Micromonospora saelicesensis]RAO57891.1 Threonine--tRNA ligase [Micromonospora saelicesensis]RAO60236.1 Threonine--tRNA ligase [Micromonospora saelicesensis]SCF13234.1 threonyl-tRNA synthetase [Micromonospora saelicesensis]